jgi:hypothetical protein
LNPAAASNHWVTCEAGVGPPSHLDELPCRSLDYTSNTRTNALAPPKRPIIPIAAPCSSSSPMNGGATPNSCASERPSRRRERPRASSRLRAIGWRVAELPLLLGRILNNRERCVGSSGDLLPSAPAFPKLSRMLIGGCIAVKLCHRQAPQPKNTRRSIPQPSRYPNTSFCVRVPGTMMLPATGRRWEGTRLGRPHLCGSRATGLAILASALASPIDEFLRPGMNGS